MKLIEHLREWSASTEEWAELVALQDRFDVECAPERAPVTAKAGARIAELLDVYADRMERSGLVRVWSSSFTPDGLRERAAEWRQRAVVAEWQGRVAQ